MGRAEERKTALQATLDSADESSPLLHPGVAELYRQKGTDLAQALEHLIRGPKPLKPFGASSTPSSSRLPRAPWKRTSSAAVVESRRRHGGRESGRQIELRRNLAAMLTMATRLRAGDAGCASARLAAGFADGQNATRSPETGDLELQIAMVAGARNPLNLEFASTAA
jgi:hypothetical protein